MSYTENIAYPPKRIHPPTPYRDRLGLVHAGLTHTAALQIRNENLVTQLTEALRRNSVLEQQIRDLQAVPRD